MPAIFYATKESDAFVARYGPILRPQEWRKFLRNKDESYFTAEVAVWERIFYAYAVTWGPTCLLGLVSLFFDTNNYVLQANQVWNKMYLSNMSIPAYIYALNELYLLSVGRQIDPQAPPVP